MKILKSKYWNGKEYHRVQLDDGSTVELCCSLEEVQEVAGRVCSEIPEECATEQALTDEQLISEVKRRKLNVLVKGEAR